MTRPPIKHLGNYYRYWLQRYPDVKNPRFDRYCGQVLNLKNRQPSAIAYFTERLKSEIPAQGVALCTVPSSTQGKLDTGIRAVAQALVNQKDTDRVDATSCLVRTRSLPKAAHGGPRLVSAHLDTIEVQHEGLIAGKTVYLLDDVVTTEASLTACWRLLTDVGATSVTCIALAKTVRE